MWDFASLCSVEVDRFLDFLELLPDLLGERLWRDQQRNDPLLVIRLRRDLDLHVECDLAAIVERVEVGHFGLVVATVVSPDNQCIIFNVH